MPNLKRGQIAYQPFKATAVLSDGLMAINRPGGEVAAAASRALFGAADHFRQTAEATAQARIENAANQVSAPEVNINGGDRKAPPLAADGASQTHPPGGLNAVIASAAAKHGQPAWLLAKIANVESRDNPKAHNASSGAAGLFQFMPATAAQYGLDNPYDAAQSADAAARLLRDNRAYLRGKLGRDPTAGELYLAHQQGAGGAAKLLNDPGAKAIDVIGRNRVLQNGGRVDMSAGDFARMWINRVGPAPVGDGFGALPDVNFDAAAATEPTRNPLTINVQGGPPQYTGRNTAFGRNYDRAVSNAYVHKLNDVMIDAGAQIAQTYANDPQGMKEAFATLRDAQLAQHVAPDMRADFDAAFSHMENQFLLKAQAGRETEVKQQQADAFNSRTFDLGQQMEHLTAGLVPGDAASLQIAQAQAARMKQHVQQGVAMGMVTPQAAKVSAARIDGDLAAAWYVRQADGKDSAAIVGLRKSLETDYRAGHLEGVDAAAWAQIDAGLGKRAAEERSKVSLDEAKFASYVADDIASVQATGKDLQVDGAALDPARVAEVLGPEQAQRWQQARDTARAVYSATAGLDKLTPDGLAEHLARIEPAPGAPGYVVAEKAHDAAVAQVKQIMQARAADPARAAEQAFPELQGLAEDAAKRKDGMKDVVTARLRAQTALGIEPMAQAPLTNNEVAPYVARLRMYAGAQDGGLDGELSRVAAELRNVYGDHADEVFAQVLHARGVGKETSKIGASFLQQLSLDQPLDYVSDAIRSTAAVQMQGAQARDVSSGGIMGVIPMFDGARVPAVPAWLQRATAVHAEGRAKPTAADVDALRKYPETLAASFDQRFGKNA